tara:strand:- start:780 stop:965 length:186 start_codon:yes stop_codon:yes gene_type:complete
MQTPTDLLQAVVLYDEKNNKVNIQLSNFTDKEDALTAARFIIATLNITDVSLLPDNEDTLH